MILSDNAFINPLFHLAVSSCAKLGLPCGRCDAVLRLYSYLQRRHVCSKISHVWMAPRSHGHLEETLILFTVLAEATQFRGMVSYYAGFIGINVSVMRQLRIMDNGGARAVCHLPMSFRNGLALQTLTVEHKISVSSFFGQILDDRLKEKFLRP